MRKTLLLAGLLALALLPACAQAPKQEVKVLYWNIQNGMWSCQDSEYQAFTAWVASQNPDICIFCEASSIYYDGSSKTCPEEERYLPEHWGELAARYGHPYWFKSAQRDNYPQVVTSRYPIESMGLFTGEEADSLISHGAGWARILPEGLSKPLNIVSCHLKPFKYGYKIPIEAREESAARFEGEQFRLREVQYLMNHTVRTAAKPDEELWLMAGDFNAISALDNFHYGETDPRWFMVHDYMAGETSPYRDLVARMHPGTFCQSHVKGRRIDFIYVTQPLLDACSQADVLLDGYTTPERSEQVENFWLPSDHFPILMVFKLD